MTNLDSGKHNKSNSCYSRRLEEVFTEDYPKEPNKETRKEPSKEKNQEQPEGSQINTTEGDQDSVLSKIKPQVQDCGLNPTHSKRIEGT
ncbi:MAG: hypothetical protein C0473_04010 [Cyanobacteria bacterium DS3.002]|nr:hypothetical protein [Cyanobacteria bacterium DS3.002]MBA4050060.1 hypothetical protein [Cyanobacteria bacterium DS2.008]